MISSADKSAIATIAARYGASRMLLFGSSCAPGREGQDIDLAVDGIEPEVFFRLYGDLMFALSKPVDLVDLSIPSLFTDMINRDGAVVYARTL